MSRYTGGRAAAARASALATKRGCEGFALTYTQTLLQTTPAELLTLMGEQFAQSLAYAGIEEPSAAQVQIFCQRAMERASALLSDEDVGHFRNRLREYLQLCDWTFCEEQLR